MAVIKILYEDDDVVAIYKPIGMPAHGDGRKTKIKTVADWVVKKYPKAKKVGESLVLKDGEEVARPGIVHRLDKDTSGVMLIAKTNEGYEYLKDQFKEKKIRKFYRAFVYGNLKEDRIFIDKPIERSASDFRQYTSAGRGRGEKRDAQTRVRVIKRVAGATYIEAMPVTGRTHQIRVHMRYLQHPVIGDTLYASDRLPILGFNRLALHAFAIEFVSVSGKEIRVEAPLPEEFISALGSEI